MMTIGILKFKVKTLEENLSTIQNQTVALQNQRTDQIQNLTRQVIQAQNADLTFPRFDKNVSQEYLPPSTFTKWSYLPPYSYNQTSLECLDCIYGDAQTRYFGQNLNGKHHGRGAMMSEREGVYEGYWKEGEMVQGRNIGPKGDVYVGEFGGGGKRDGYGLMRYGNGTREVGDWVLGKFNED